MVLVTRSSSIIVMRNVSTEAGIPAERTRAVRPMACGASLKRRLVMTTSTAVGSVRNCSSRMPSALRISASASASWSRAEVLPAHPVDRDASSGRALTGNGPVPRSCGVIGLFGLPLSAMFTPTSEPYIQ